MIGASWNQIRNTYAHILRKIENREITWSADFDRFEKHIYEKVALKFEKSDKKEKHKSPASYPTKPRLVL